MDEKNEVKEVISDLEKTYMKYFGNLEQIDAVYHREQRAVGVFSKVVPIAEVNKLDELEMVIRGALLLNDDGYRNRVLIDLQFDQMLNIRSVLANLPKIQNVQLKKSILMVFRRYEPHVSEKSDAKLLHKHKEDLRQIVAYAAIANGLATTTDLYETIMYTKDAKYMNDLVAQAKEDIKAEMATNIPSYNEIDHICSCVLRAAKELKWPEASIANLEQEFDKDQIIAGGDYVAKYAKTIEVDHAEVETYKNKAAWVDRYEKENETLQKEKAAMVKNIATLAEAASQMRPSLFSRGVKKYQAMIASVAAQVNERR